MVEVYKQISIAVLSTGNELKEPWQKLQTKRYITATHLQLLFN